MDGRGRYFRSKLARRFFLLFIGCAILPVGVLAALSLLTVSRQLGEESRQRLHQDAKAVGQSVIERLLFLEAELRLLRPPPEAAGPTGFRPGGDARERFRGVAAARPDRPPRGLAGRVDPAASLTPAQWGALQAGWPVVFSRPAPDGSRSLYLATRPGLPMDDVPALIGEIDPAYLWGTGEDGNLPPMTELAVIELPETLLASTLPVPASLVARVASGGVRTGPLQFRWEGQEQGAYMASAWPLFLQGRFASPPWVLVLSQSVRDVRAPLVNFYATFPAVLLLTMLAVFLLSMSQIRRSLVPLERLREGTGRIAAQEFASRVEIASGDEFEELGSAFNQMAGRLGRQWSALATAAEITQGVLSSLDVATIMRTAVSRLRDLCPCDEAAGILAGRDPRAATLFLAGEPAGEEGTRLTVHLGPEDLGELRASPRVAVRADGDLPAYLDRLALRGIRAATLLPIFLAERLAGILVLGYRAGRGPDPEALEAVRQLADQVAVALANARLVEELEQLHWGTLIALARAIDAKSHWTAGHSERVTRLALRVGRALGLSRGQLDALHRGGLLHDIGKIGIPPEILDKASLLEPRELEIMRDHPWLGARILEPIAAYAEVLPVVLQHHEWYDGTGYPEGLAGEAIALEARIFAVADVYDALRSDRPYRGGMPQAQVLAYLRQGSGRQFDPQVVEAFLRVMAEPDDEEPAPSAEEGRPTPDPRPAPLAPRTLNPEP